jgi:hypothetical protein
VVTGDRDNSLIQPNVRPAAEREGSRAPLWIARSSNGTRTGDNEGSVLLRVGVVPCGQPDGKVGIGKAATKG